MLFSAVALRALAPANVPAHGFDLFDRPGWPAQIGRHVGEIDARHRFRAAAATRAGRINAKRCRQQHGRDYLEHASVLFTRAKGRLRVLNMIRMIFSHDCITINEKIFRITEVRWLDVAP
jgi:hypothetical protein